MQHFAGPSLTANGTPAYQHGEARDTAFLDLRQMLNVLWRRRAWIIVTTLSFMAIAIAYAFLSTPNYSASTRILIDPRGLKILDKEVNPSARGGSGAIELVESQMRVLSADTVLFKVIDELKLAGDPEFIGPSRNPIARLKGWIRRQILGPGEPQDRRLDALRTLHDKLSVGREPRSYVIDVTVSSRDRSKAVKIANAVAATYINSESAARSSFAARASTSLTRKLEDLRKNLHEAEGRVERYKAEHNIVGAGGRLVDVQQISELNTRLVAARARLAQVRSRMQQIEALNRTGATPDAIVEAVRSPAVARLRDQYGAVRRREAALSSQLRSAHPRLAALRAQRNDIRRLLNEELRRISRGAKLDLERTRDEVKRLEGQLKVLKGNTFATNAKLVRLRELKRDADASRLVYEAFLVRAREIGEQKGLDSSLARIISPAIPARDPSGPSKTVLLALALLFGLGVGSVLAHVRETTDKTIRTGEQLTGATGLPVLGYVPKFVHSEQANLACAKGGPAATRSREVAADGELPLFLLDERNRHCVAEMARLVDHLNGASVPGRARSLMFTAASRFECKTTVAANFAQIAAESGQKVLLIDGDIADRTLSRLCARDPDWGMEDVAAGACDIRDAVLWDERLSCAILPLANVHRSAHRHLKLEDFRAKVLMRADEVDLIVIDGGALATSPSARLFAAACDEIVLCARAGVTDRDVVTNAVAALSAQRRKIHGFVLCAG